MAAISIDFDALAVPFYETLFGYAFPHSVFSRYVEGSLVFSTDGHGFGTTGTVGDPSIFNNSGVGTVYLRSATTNSFSITSMDLDAYETTSGPVTFHFVGTTSGGQTVAASFTTDAAAGLETFTFAATFTNLAELRWTVSGTAGWGIFDNVLADATETHTFTGSVERDAIAGTSGDDLFLMGSSDPQDVYFKAGQDRVHGHGGDDVFYFGGGTFDFDAVDGGAGHDRLVLQGNYSVALRTVGVESVLLLAGSDIAYGDLAGNFYSYNLNPGDAVATGALLTVDGSALRAGESLSFDGSLETDGRFELIGGSDADALSGGAQNDTITGGNGNDVLNGGGGNDTLNGEAGDDILDGETGDDIMTGGIGDDTYRVDSVGDVVNELLGQGTDTLAIGFSYVLANGSAIENLATINQAATTAINLTGNDLAQTLAGNAGANVLDGKAGADTMWGYGGDDTFYVRDAGDTVFEAAGEGDDTVIAYKSFVLGAGQEVELLRTPGSASTSTINLTGNELAQTLLGNAGTNTLNGGGGADYLRGYAGNDTYFVDNAGDVVVEAAGGGTDTVVAAASFALGTGQEVETLRTLGSATTYAANLSGNALAQTLVGNAAANVLDGKGGADTMVGYAGDDTYYVDNAADVVIEANGGGSDTVIASVSYTLGTGRYIEVLRTLGSGTTDPLNLTGNEFANTLYGNAAANVLDGKLGGDTMRGYAGNDTYYVDHIGDSVIEAAGGGSDTVIARVSHTLGAGQEVELLRTWGSGTTDAVDLIGNDLANTIYGNAAENVLDGKGGFDTLRGYAGHDTFAFTTALGAANVDTILDFSAADDTIAIDNAVFAGLAGGALAAGAFNTGAGATQADDRIVYNSATGALLFDADGSGAGAAVQFATLAGGLALAASDFLVI